MVISHKDYQSLDREHLKLKAFTVMSLPLINRTIGHNFSILALKVGIRPKWIRVRVAVFCKIFNRTNSHESIRLKRPFVNTFSDGHRLDVATFNDNPKGFSISGSTSWSPFEISVETVNEVAIFFYKSKSPSIAFDFGNPVMVGEPIAGSSIEKGQFLSWEHFLE